MGFVWDEKKKFEYNTFLTKNLDVLGGGGGVIF